MDSATRLSKATARLLRHAPHANGLEPDADGWVDIDELVTALRRSGAAWRDIDASNVREMVRRSSKKRFEIAGGRIRALYGHSFPGGVVKQPERPPARLFHGTAPSAAATILKQGLRPMRRQFVHLSVDVPAAVEVGGRRSRTVEVLEVASDRAHDNGVLFYRGNDDVWLADHVPARFLKRVRRS